MNNDYTRESFRPADSLISGNFVLTLKKEIIENRKPLLLGVGGIWGFCLLIGCFLGYNTYGGSAGELFTFTLAFLAIGCIAASVSFSNLKNKDTRIASILVPDTPFDKFFIRWLAVVPALCCVMIAGFYITELARIITFKLTYDAVFVENCGSYCKVLNLWTMLANPAMGNSLRSTFAMSYFFSQSFYILGAVLWPKLSFIKTFAAMWVLQTLFSIVVVSIDRINIAVNFDTNSFLWCVAATEFVITVAVYVLAYIRYRNTQVVYKLF